MFQSLKIGRLLGIDVYLHGTFWLLPLFVLLGGATGPHGVALDLAVLFAVFGCVALHELGHAVAAGWFGIRTRDITLSPIGGVARLENVPDKPWPEIVIALAGPAVNVVIAAFLGAVMLFDGVSVGRSLGGGSFLEAFFARLLIANAFLVLFNLIPAFPMDGGRVFRAGMSLFVGREPATELATILGSVLAVGFVLGGFYLMNPMLALIGVAVFLMGRAELAAVRYQEEQKRHAARWRHAFDWVEPRIPVARPVRRPAGGWEWDAVNQRWTLYRSV